jgi:hypothetical protein
MRRRFRRHDDTETALANFALTFAKALLVFSVMLFLMINPQQQKTDGVRPKLEYLMTMDWPVDLDYDVDVWVRDPNGNILYYSNKEVGFLVLERDDLGKKNNTVMVNGQPVTIQNNEELVGIRGFNPGGYVVNAHLYSIAGVTNANTPVPPFKVHLKIQKINPIVKTMWEGDATISFVKQEVHLVRFTMLGDGRLVEITNEMPVMLREQIAEESQRGAGMYPPGPVNTYPGQ